jgi:hypothetical protein
VVTVLLKEGADGTARSISGRTAFDYAQENPKLQEDEQVLKALEIASK